MFTIEEIELLKRITIKLNGKTIDIEVINSSTIIVNGQEKSISFINNKS